MGLTAACGRAGVHTRCRTTDLSRGEREEPSDWSQATGTPRRAGRTAVGIMDPTGRIMKNLHAAILVPRGPGSRARTPGLIDATYPRAIVAP